MISRIQYMLTNHCDLPEVGWGPWAGRSSAEVTQVSLDRLLIPNDEPILEIENALFEIFSKAHAEFRFFFKLSNEHGRPEYERNAIVRAMATDKSRIGYKLLDTSLVATAGHGEGTAKFLINAVVNCWATGRPFLAYCGSNITYEAPWNLIRPLNMSELIGTVGKDDVIIFDHASKATSTDCFDLFACRYGAE